jgi:hypothetical protein
MIVLTQKYIKELKASGNWMIRNSNDGVGYGGFKWEPVGEWTTCPKWTRDDTCEGGGLFGQGLGGMGYMGSGTRFELCETDPIRVSLGDKIKTPRAKIIAVNQEAFDVFMVLCSGKFAGQLIIPSGVEISAPALAKCGNVYVYEGASFTVPVLAKCNDVVVREGASFTVPALAKCNNVYVREGASFTVPVLAKCNDVVVYEGASFTVPVLAKCNNVVVYEGGSFTAPALAKCNDVYVREGASFTAPQLKRK